MMSKLRRIPVLDCILRSTLAITRCLGRHGMYPVVAAETDISLAGASRICRAQVYHPRLTRRHWLLSMSYKASWQNLRLEVIPPAIDATYLLATRHQHTRPGARLLSPVTGIDLLSNENALFKQVEAMKAPAPELHYIDNQVEPLHLADNMTKQVVLKRFFYELRTYTRDVLA